MTETTLNPLCRLWRFGKVGSLPGLSLLRFYPNAFLGKKLEYSYIFITIRFILCELHFSGGKCAAFRSEGGEGHEVDLAKPEADGPVEDVRKSFR